MNEAGIGRVLVASLHQGIADLLPSRLEFYEFWLTPVGLREGRIGLAPLGAVLSFLRQEGDMYPEVAARAGECAADWTLAETTPLRRRVIQAAPPWLRRRLVAGLACELVHVSHGASHAKVHWRRETATIDIRGSIFCQVRETASAPLCAYYASAVRTLMTRFGIETEVSIAACRGCGASACRLDAVVQPAPADV